jgi:outer membrane protein OmpA-like peptidoglycan-associated protein
MIVTLGNVLFDFDKSELRTGAMRNLYPLVSFLKDDPSRTAIIEGHTDNVGPPAYNLDLSRRRAEAVRQFLIDSGIAPNRVSARGLGDSYPVASNNTPEGRQMNRRVAIVFTSSAGN